MDINNNVLKEKKDNKKISKTAKTIIWVVSIITVFLLFRWIGISTPLDTQKSELEKGVNELKTKIGLPKKIDELTTIVDITAEPNAIRYHYVLSGVDSSNFTNDYFKKSMISDVCKSEDAKKFFDYGINQEYSYTIKNTSQNFFVSFTKEDCLNY